MTKPLNFTSAPVRARNNQPLSNATAADVTPTVPGEEVTRVMSPNAVVPYTVGSFGGGQGWLDVAKCPRCNTFCQDPVICSGCGAFGHPGCVGAEMFQGLPFCGECFSGIALDFANRRNAEMREEWRRTQTQSLVLWKSRVTTILGVSTTMGETIGAASAAVVSTALAVASGIKTGVLESVNIIQTTHSGAGSQNRAASRCLLLKRLSKTRTWHVFWTVNKK